MDCKITFIKRRRTGGFTLVEFLVSSGIGAIFFAVIGSLIYYSAWCFVAMANYAMLERSSRHALDLMSREIRQAGDLVQWSPTEVVLVYTNGNLRYAFQNRELIRELGGAKEVLLNEVDNGRFSVFQRNPVNGAYDQYPVGTPGTTKLIQMDWRCSRQIFGAKVNTESVQSAKIVIRRQ